ncbi:MAG: sulfatase-like hydrolase/transferase [Undibacterium sp.]|nr:sulfatase-like hydrolase/transferase [Undibacterium sp.]MDO8701633.1 sulfatase-like hydrolase/transferase [Undibacterium sp.]
MKSFNLILKSSRYRLLFALGLTFLSICLLTRLVLGVTVLNETGLFDLLKAIIVGTAFDLITAIYVLTPTLLLLLFIPERWLHSKIGKIIQWIWLALHTYGLMFVALSEWLFWSEFGNRFDFIAVDYLVYTHEVIGNIKESYPVPLLLGALAIPALIMTIFFGRLMRPSNPNTLNFGHRIRFKAMWFSVFALSLLANSDWRNQISGNRYTQELAGNGTYQFWHAFRHNQLNYERHYASIPNEEALQKLRTLLQTPEASFVSNDLHSIERQISHTGPEKRLNVVLISIESMSADFLTAYGNTKGITPNFDALRSKSLVFDRLYANGTRTVRGLEALALSVPPTPGQSIVKRLDNQGLFSLGHVFRQKNYETLYLYGGYGYFDNMTGFFGTNEYKVVDRSSIDKKDIHFENIWGVADEDLFTLSLSEFDKSSAASKPFFAHIMTTSNHRPFTYPDGRIDIPSHTNREGGVKYTDWAIGDFIKRASQHAWFKDTIFIITADHCASSAGKTGLPVNQYHIPLLIYSPAHIAPAVNTRLMSQIDLAPTLLGLLNFSYRSKFFGYDINVLEPGRERAFIGNYQEIGYLTADALTTLSTQKKTAAYTVDWSDGSTHKKEPDPETLMRTKTYYQTASWLYNNGGLKAQ